MQKYLSSIIWYAIIAGIAGVFVPDAVMAQCEVLGVHFRGDELFPQFYRFWQDYRPVFPDDPDLGAETYTYAHKLGGSVHVYVQNRGSQPLTIENVLLEGFDLNQCIAFAGQRKERDFANIRFADLSESDLSRLIEAGEPVWWKVDPQQILPGETSEVVIRLRYPPKLEQIHLTLVHGSGKKSVAIPALSAKGSVAGVVFSQELDRVLLYFKRSDAKGQKPAKILIDGKDVTAQATMVSDPAIELVPVEIRLSEPLQPSSLHCFQGVYEDGVTTSASAHSWADEFAYGMWGSLRVNESKIEEARAHVEDLVLHNINVQMPQLGSPGVRAFYKSEEGHRYCESVGLRQVVEDPGKRGVKDPLMYFLKDEPDCADSKMVGQEINEKIGGLARWVIECMQSLRKQDPSTPQFLNVDNTFRPENWYTYGQLPDILSIDPYYSPRMMGSYWRHPYRRWLYTKATFVYGSACVAFSACEPKPLHVVLNVIRRIEKERTFRFPTPDEKRIEVYYSLAGGAKGISYWWFNQAHVKWRGKIGVTDGLGSARSDPEAAKLWNGIGLLGAEVRTAGPVILRSCPVEIKAESNRRMLWPRCLLAGLDTMVLLVVNERYANDRVGTVHVPLDDVKVTVPLPAWLDAKSVFEISHKGVPDLDWAKQGSSLTVDLDTVDLTRMVVITKDKTLRDKLQKLYSVKFADNVAELLNAQSASQPY